MAICECSDINASIMAVSIDGRHALVSGRKSMLLVDIDGNQADSLVTPSGSDGVSAASPTGAEAPSQASNMSANIYGKNVPLVKRMSRNAKYEPTACQFNRHMADLFGLTTYQVIEVFSLDNLNPLKPNLTLRGHSRAIADIEWSQFDPYLLGSSAADCLTNLWDIRDSRRPSASLTSVSGATQLRFSKTSSNLIATSHEIDVRIWDIRQPNLPLYYIAAHLQKINGMDWNPSKTNCDQDQLITCSQDNTIKLWNLNSNKIKPSASFTTKAPAWRVRFAPGSGNPIVTSTLPQLRSRSDCLTLKLWSINSNRYEQKKLELLLGLVGHSDVIVDFDWRNRPAGSDYEIVSWSKDRSLRVWRVDHQFIEMNVDHSDFETEADLPSAIRDPVEIDSINNETTSYQTKPANKTISENEQSNNATTTMTTSKQHYQLTTKSPLSPSDIDELRISTSKQQSSSSGLGGELSTSDQSSSRLDDSEGPYLANELELKQEFNLINKNIPNLEFEEIDSLRRLCIVTGRSKSIICRLRIAIPLAYPQSECPTFALLDSNRFGCENLDNESKEKLLQMLNETAKLQLSRSRNCIEPCLRKFIASLQKLATSATRKRSIEGFGQDSHLDPITLSAQRDHSVPFPPTSRARFCGNLLVCFGRPLLPKVNATSASSDDRAANWLVETPRSMAQLSAQLDNMRRQGSYNLSQISISYFYYGAMRRPEMLNRNQPGGGQASSSGAGALGAATGAGSGSGSTLGQAAARRGKSLLPSQSMSRSYKCGPVIVYDASKLLGGISRELAENYVFDKDVIKMCRRNAQVAASLNRKDLVQIWSLAELSSEGALNSFMATTTTTTSATKVSPLGAFNHQSDFGERPWTMHPFGSKLIQSLIDHYVNNCRDVQTAAMLVWTFSSPKLGRSYQSQQQRLKQAGLVADSDATTSDGQQQRLGSNATIEHISDEWSVVVGPRNGATGATTLYSSSWSNSNSNSTMHQALGGSTGAGLGPKQAGAADSAGGGGGGGGDNTSYPKLNILDPMKSLQNDLIMHVYAELLYRLNLLNQRAMLLKNVGSDSAYSELFATRQATIESPDEKLPKLTIQCSNPACRTKCQSVQCSKCKSFSLSCSICRLPVRGSCSVCLKCQHGGHVNHFSSWFSIYDFCPTGCGCKCLTRAY